MYIFECNLPTKLCIPIQDGQNINILWTFIYFDIKIERNVTWSNFFNLKTKHFLIRHKISHKTKFDFDIQLHGVSKMAALSCQDIETDIAHISAQ